MIEPVEVRLVTAIALYLDISVLGNDNGEESVTEITQVSLVMMTILIFAVGAVKQPASRGFYTLVAGFSRWDIEKGI